MSIRNSKTGEVLRTYTIDELKQQANLMRGYNLVSLCAASSGHAGGTLSIMDIAAALYLRVANHDPQNPDWPERDRFILSKGHAAPLLYAKTVVVELKLLASLKQYIVRSRRWRGDWPRMRSFNSTFSKAE